MFEVEINRDLCKGCGACVRVSSSLYLDDDNLINMDGALVDDNTVEGIVSNIHEIETAASICPMDCFVVFDDEDNEVKIKRNANI